MSRRIIEYIEELFGKYNYSDIEAILYAYMRFGITKLSNEDFNKIRDKMSELSTIFNEELNIHFDYLMEE